jgi:uncharacterized protein
MTEKQTITDEEKGKTEIEEEGEVGKKKKRRTIKELLRKAIKSNDSPKKIALGLALGVLMAFSPLAGTQTISSLGLAFVFKANKLSALAGSFFANPFTMPIIYFLELKLGKTLLGYSLELPSDIVNDIPGLMSLGSEVMLSLTVGFFLLGTAVAIIAYFIMLRSVFAYRKMREHLREKKD